MKPDFLNTKLFLYLYFPVTSYVQAVTNITATSSGGMILFMFTRMLVKVLLEAHVNHRDWY